MNYQYKPICKENQLITGTGQVAIVTGWTPKERVAKLFSPDQYAVIGNLYSKGGIDYIVRNLLANPHVTVVMILAATKEDRNSKACEQLRDLFVKQEFSPLGKDLFSEEGVRPCVYSLTQGTYWHWVESVEELSKRVKKVFDNPFIYVPNPIRTSFIYLPQEHRSDILPGQLYGQRVEGKTISDVWVKILQRIRTNGLIRPSGYDNRQELINLVAIVTNEYPDSPSIPDPNWLPVDYKYLKSYYPQMIEDSLYVDGVKYTYGQRLRSWFGCDQIEQVIKKICEEKDTASAVMSLWDSGSGNHKSQEWEKEQLEFAYEHLINPGTERWGRTAGDSDHDHSGSPCLNHIWMRVIDNALTMTATFRSNDMFQAWATNAYGLRKLQEHIRLRVNELTQWDLSLGNLITISQSAHIYDYSFAASDEIIANQYPRLCQKERISFRDAVGNFLIERKTTDMTKGSGGQAFSQFIQVTQMNRDGNTVRIYKGDIYQPLQLVRDIVETNPSISPSHAAYLGIEIQKASDNTKYLGSSYIQDK